MNPRRTTVIRRSLSLVLCAAAFFTISGAAFCGDEPADQPQTTQERSIEHFSDKGRVFKALKADPREAQFRLGYMNNYSGESFLDFVFGGDAALLRSTEGDGRESSLSVRGLVAPRFQFTSDSFDLLNTDFQGGLAFGTALGELSWEVYVFHQSSHLGDEVLAEGIREKIDYSKEGVRFLASRTWGPLRLYGGGTVNLRTEPHEYDEHLVPQCGLEWWFAGGERPAYLALDLRSREGNDWNVNTTLQIGVELGDVAKVENRHRVFIEFFTGYSEMGQFYNESESYVLAGVAYNLR